MMHPNYSFTEAYEDTVNHTDAALRKVKFPRAKLEDPVCESFLCNFQDYESIYVATFHLLVNRKDTELLPLEVSSVVDMYHTSKATVQLQLSVGSVILDTPQKLEGFIGLLKRAGRTIEDMYAYLNGIDGARSARPSPSFRIPRP